MVCIAIRTLPSKFRNVPSRIGVYAEQQAEVFHHSIRTASSASTTLRRVGAQIVHRHGDRSPITPLKNEEYWAKQLVTQNTLDKISSNTELVEDSKKQNRHNANGRGPFGKLSELGLLQLVELGTRLKEELEGDDNALSTIDEQGRTFHPHIFTKDHRPMAPDQIRVISTNFLRTIQSVQGLLVGFFPDVSSPEEDDSSYKIPIDIRHTDIMIPDPQPRRTIEQAELEEQLAVRPHILQREEELLDLAVSTTAALHDLLAPDAHEADFGVPQHQDHPSQETIEVQPLSWNQLAEITKCLAVRDLLPDCITKADQERISQHAAWRWFEAFRDARLSHLSMGDMTSRMMEYFENSNDKPLTIWSAHDSTLICLMCAFRLEQPAVWPEYGSYIMLELLEQEQEENSAKELYVRFSLNGNVLRSQWNKDQPAVEMIKLSELTEHLRSQAELTAPATTTLEQ